MGSSNSVLDGSLNGDVFFKSHSWHALHPFTNFMNNVAMNIVYWIARCIFISFTTCSYPSCLLSLNVNTFHGMFLVCLFWHLCFKQEDQLIEWMNKGQVVMPRINIPWYNSFVFRKQLPFLGEKTWPPHLLLVGLMAGRQMK